MPTKAVKQSVAPSMMEKAVCISVSIECLGNTRKVSSSQVEVNADKELVKVQKQLIDCDEFDRIRSFDGDVRRFVYSRCLPNKAFKQGVYLVPLDLIEDVDKRLKKFVEERKELIEAFVRVYPAHIKMAKDQLRDLFDETDYLTADEVRAAFKLEWSYFDFGVSDKLTKISKAMYDREKIKAQRSWELATVEVQKALRVGMADLVNHLVDRLSGGADGKPKVFRNTIIENVNDFLKTFDARNITDDQQLKSLVDKAKKLLNGVDADTLRDYAGDRNTVATGFAAIKKQLDTMIVDKPKRGIALGD